MRASLFLPFALYYTIPLALPQPPGNFLKFPLDNSAFQCYNYTNLPSWWY